MRSKLTTAFIIVALLVVIIIAGTTSFSAKVMFEQYLDARQENQKQQWIDFFTLYYEQYGSFEELELVTINTMIRGSVQPGRGMPVQRGAAIARDRMLTNQDERMLLIGLNNTVIYDSWAEIVGTTVEDREVNKGTAIKVNDDKVATLIIRDNVLAAVMSLEDQFTRSMNTSILIASVVTLLLAAGIGLLLSSRMSRDLLLLKQSVKNVADKNYQGQVIVESQDEIGELANSFNEMVTAVRRNEHSKNKLITDIAHELRTPITTLRGKLEMLQNSAEALSQHEVLILHDEVLRLSRLVNDLQDVTMLEDGRLSMNYEAVNIRELLEHIVQIFDWELQEKSIVLSEQYLASNHLVKADKNRMTQVIINLLTNAIRYMKDTDKMIKINTENIRIDDGTEQLLIIIKDTGVGMEEHELDNVFERFYRGDKSRARITGGSGLGLSIVKGIVEAHAGTIEVASKVGEGSTFTIKLKTI